MNWLFQLGPPFLISLLKKKCLNKDSCQCSGSQLGEEEGVAVEHLFSCFGVEALLTC